MKAPKFVIIRTYLIYFLVVLVMLVIVGKTIMIVMEGRENVFTTANSKMPERIAYISPRRGEILDCHFNPLVTSVSFYDVYMDPVTVDKKLWNEGIQGLSEGLANLFHDKTARQYENQLRRARNHGDRYVLIKKRVTYQQRKKLRELPIFKAGKYKGGLIDNQETIVRKRPNGGLLARTLGYVRESKKDTLLVGLEGAYNKYLSGKKGIIMQQLIANKWRPTGTVIRPPENGHNIVTSIDEDIQEVANNELLHQLQVKGGRYGCVIVMNVKTGFIKAIVNLQETADGQYAEVYNNAIGTREVPGSTMKLASLLAALEDGKIKLTDTIDAKGHYRFFDHVIDDSNYGRGYGKITIKQAFEYSSNVISKVIYNAYKDDPKQYFDRLNQFGITQESGIGINGEAKPRYSYPGNASWWAGSLGWMGIGYEFELTPLELLSFYNAVANDGNYMKPQLVKEVVNNKRVIKKFDPVVLHPHIASMKNIKLMQNAMKGVMVVGTGHRLKKSTFFKLAGKTGTAEIANHNKGYGKPGEKKYLASFVGYFPADDPIYSCLVSVAAPSNDIYGASVSGTVFAAIANKVYANSYQYHSAVNEKPQIATVPKVKDGDRFAINTVLNHFDIKKDLNGNSDWIKAEPTTDDKIRYSPLPMAKKEVPNVIGLGLRDAMYLLEKQGMIVQIEGSGTVVKQSVVPGTMATKGRKIELTLN